MSRAFVKEDIDPPERSRRARASSGLPPGAANYITSRGADKLKAKLEDLRKDARADVSRIRELEELLSSVTIVEPANDPNTIAFGARVTVRRRDGTLQTYTIVGVDELEFYADGVSWISPIGKALLAGEVADRIHLEDERVEIVAAEYPPN